MVAHFLKKYLTVKAKHQQEGYTYVSVAFEGIFPALVDFA